MLCIICFTLLRAKMFQKCILRSQIKPEIEENQKILDFEEKQRIKRKLSKRVFYPDTDTVKSPWNNINRAFMEVENLGIKLEDEGNKEDLEFLYKIKDLLEKIEKEFK